jgi:hypothetical protein
MRQNPFYDQINTKLKRLTLQTTNACYKVNYSGKTKREKGQTDLNSNFQKYF